MARLKRLSLPGVLQLLTLQAPSQVRVLEDDEDYQSLLSALRLALGEHAISLHAYGLFPGEVWLLLTPGATGAEARYLQAVGRRFGASYNRRHGRTGPIWAGRYRSAPIDATAHILDAMVLTESADQACVLQGEQHWRWSSAAHHAGRATDPVLTPHPAFWALGNTPFEREAIYRRLFSEGLSATLRAKVREAALKGWPLGDAQFLSTLTTLQSKLEMSNGDGLTVAHVVRPLQPRRPGRPKKIKERTKD